MKKLTSLAGLTLAIAIAACSGETAANGNGAGAGDAEADTSQNWSEVVSKTEAGGYRMGKPDAPVQIVEFASLTCGACGNFSDTAFDPLVENYVSQGLVNFEIRNFVRDPLDLSAALLSRCNGADPYFGITERMFANQAEMFNTVQSADQTQLQQLATPAAVQSGAAFVGFAEAAGLIDFVGSMGISGAAARQCLTDPAGRQELEEMRNQAINQYNVPGTPTFLINGEVVPNVTTWAQLEPRIQELLQ
ncbi:MAG: DsbA family protein [Parasphingopyxis sp.]|nr:DsbA family protein [Sphingomonadales bacterium]